MEVGRSQLVVQLTRSCAATAQTSHLARLDLIYLFSDRHKSKCLTSTSVFFISPLSGSSNYLSSKSLFISSESGVLNNTCYWRKMFFIHYSGDSNYYPGDGAQQVVFYGWCLSDSSRFFSASSLEL